MFMLTKQKMQDLDLTGSFLKTSDLEFESKYDNFHSRKCI